ncbi:hypothetical protein F7725_001881 [Dissostichus mawsoni]|uniref:C2H2-type domain-containing protein n=1 Tax=Dissostichus mawsoni TaxID=36200 RepID=A0A7J5Y0U3_DISMA|nr:hypothetical protein F7725_001881 [Dissostichus mawsoni]
MLDKTSAKDQQTGQCSDCGCSLPQLDSDTTSTSSPPSKCASCQAGSSLPNGRRPHRRLRLDPHSCSLSSEDLKCGVCCRTFVRSSYIRLHIRLNKGQRPYHCKVCNKTFVKLDTFVNHCDKHLRQKRAKSGVTEVQDKVVKPPMFVPLSRPPSPESLPTQPLSSEVNTRSRAKAKSKTEP